MAWWLHPLLFRKKPEENTREITKESQPLFALFRRAVSQYIYENFIDILYLVLSAFTYFYLAISVIAFFFENKTPKILPYAVDLLAEPYLGALATYVVVREIEKRKGKTIQKRWGEMFVAVWLIFLTAATVAIYFSGSYHLNETYKTVAANTLATIIIRIGTFIR